MKGVHIMWENNQTKCSDNSGETNSNGTNEESNPLLDVRTAEPDVITRFNKADDKKSDNK